MASWTKRQIVLKALGATGLVEGDGSTTAPEMLQDGMSSLDAMMAQWDSMGIRLGYLGAATPSAGDLSDNSGLPDYSVRAVYTNLAIELAGGVGREVSPRIAAIASKSYDALVALFSQPTPYRFPQAMPAGAGNKPWGGTGFFILDATDAQIDAGLDSELEFN